MNGENMNKIDNTTILFDKSSVKFIAEAFGYKVSEDGGIVNSNNEDIVCAICKQKLTGNNLGAIIKNVGFICNSTLCLLAIESQLTLPEDKI